MWAGGCDSLEWNTSVWMIGRRKNMFKISKSFKLRPLINKRLTATWRLCVLIWLNGQLVSFVFYETIKKCNSVFILFSVLLCFHLEMLYNTWSVQYRGGRPLLVQLLVEWLLHEIDVITCFDRCGDVSSQLLLVSIVDSISACHAEDRGSIPRRGVSLFTSIIVLLLDEQTQRY